MIDATGIGPMILQVGANEGQIMEIDIPKISLSEMGLDNYFVKEGDGTENDGKGVWTLNVSTKEAATEAIDRVDGALQFLSSIRGRLGDYQNNDQKLGHHIRKYDGCLFQDYGCGYGRGNDELYHLSGNDAGCYFHVGAGK